MQAERSLGGQLVLVEDKLLLFCTTLACRDGHYDYSAVAYPFRELETTSREKGLYSVDMRNGSGS